MTAVVAEDQLAIGPGRILGRETTRFGERLKLRDALVQPESEEPLEPFRQPRQALMAETLVARRRAGEEPRHCSAAGPVVGSPADRLKARFRSTNEPSAGPGTTTGQWPRRAVHPLSGVRVTGLSDERSRVPFPFLCRRPPDAPAPGPPSCFPVWRGPCASPLARTPSAH